MTNLDNTIEKVLDVQNRFDDIRGQLKGITESVLTIAELMGIAFEKICELEGMLEEMEVNNGKNISM